MFSNEEEMLRELANGSDKYQIKCDTIILTPILSIYKEGKLVTKSKITATVYNGSMNPEYGDKFFSDTENAAKEGFILQLRESFKEKIKEEQKILKEEINGKPQK